LRFWNPDLTEHCVDFFLAFRLIRELSSRMAMLVFDIETSALPLDMFDKSGA